MKCCSIWRGVATPSARRDRCAARRTISRPLNFSRGVHAGRMCSAQSPNLLDALAPRDHHRAAQPQKIQHAADIASGCPARRDPGVRLCAFKHARRQRTFTAQSGENHAAQRVVVHYPFADAARPHRIVGGVVSHERVMNRIIFGQDDGRAVRPVLEQFALAPQQRVEMRAIVRAETAPQHEPMTACDDADRIELQSNPGRA